MIARTSYGETGRKAAMLHAGTSYNIKPINEKDSTISAKRKTPWRLECRCSLRLEGKLTDILENACTAPILPW